ncbi:hypothetical protein SOVF_158240 [Spinacia oleracea]|uniref:Trihelix transcription factor GT-4 isoform X2 n=1 Tax=Spinacia oleracea TaxID=3562 RepID=A0A9R0IRT1_SPIOL|nr:trihelix transcription factor GT-4-like isoform X2 [Spinacia oleracea]KNA08924.1 hypothetical protein SOVF_158240 [Spinacia oleracea]
MLEGEDDVRIGGRVVNIKLGNYVKKIGIDGSPKAIKEAIRASFGLRTRRVFWLEDDEGIVRCIDRDMPLRDYTLNLDKGLTIRINLCEAANEIPVHVEEKTFYMEADFYDFLHRHGFVALRDLNCQKNVDSIGDLHSGELYQGLQAPAS